MEIRKAGRDDLDEMMQIYGQARAFMRENGNPQWGDGYPSREWIERDSDKMYLCVEQGKIACVFYYAQEEDEDYRVIDGTWLKGGPYGVVHRVASSGLVKGAAKFCLDWAFSQTKNIRIDTHRANVPMQRLLEKCGFQLCGTFQRIGMEWLAYQKIQREETPPETKNRIQVGIGVLIIRDGKLLLGHRVQKGEDTGGIYEPDTWCLPGGKQEYGETILEGAAREVKEETNLEIENMIIFGAADDIQPDRHFVTLHVAAYGVSGEPKVMEPKKQDAWQWFDIKNLPENLYSPSRKLIEAYLYDGKRPFAKTI